VTRILILHASVGTGHLSAARALAQAFEQTPGVEARVEDTLDFGSRAVADAIIRGYLQLSGRAPSVWKALYEATDVTDTKATLAANARRGRLGRPLFGRLARFVREYAPDAVVCTHFLPLEILIRDGQPGSPAAGPAAQGSQPSPPSPPSPHLPVYCVITDYMVHGLWLNEGVQRYFVASEPTRLALLERGVAGPRIEVSGIPVRPEIAEAKSAPEMRRKHGLPDAGPLLTLFGGGVEARRVRLIVERLLAGGEPATLAVVAGRNEALSQALAPLTDGPQVRLRRYERIDFVDDLVAASDLVITKPGGLIVSEVLARATPLIIIDPIAGHEEWNADFVAGSGAGIQLRYPDGVALAARYLVADEARLALMRRQAQRVGRPRAALDVAARVLSGLPGGLPMATPAPGTS
jgi:processive 1,2-diacylglycerol beta-glucosyltransferase